jgi:hypothetical protein
MSHERESGFEGQFQEADQHAGPAFLPLPYHPLANGHFRDAAPLNGVEPLAWLTDVLERMVSGRTKAAELERLLPWAWKAERLVAAVHA